MNKFNENEFLRICNQFNILPTSEEVLINYPTDSFYNKMKKSVEKDRRGEVVFCVIRPNAKIVAVTCSIYPKGVFRIPTGGIGHTEDIIEAVLRETKEELGVEVEIMDFGGVLKIKFSHGDDSVMFYSYLFILRETGGRLLVDASDDEISEVKEVDISELESIAENLANIKGKWSDWGRFRYASTNTILQFLKKNAEKLGLKIM